MKTENDSFFSNNKEYVVIPFSSCSFVHRNRKCENIHLVSYNICRNPLIFELSRCIFSHFPLRSRDEIDDVPADESGEETTEAAIENVNQPALIATYKDPLTLCEKLCLVVDLPSGVTDIQLKLPGIGPAASILLVSYLWPELVYNVTALFDKEIKVGIMTATHPAITALKLELEKRDPLF